MPIKIYDTSLIVLGCMLCYLGAYLILGGIPQRLKNSSYERSRRFMGAAYLVIALSIAVFFTMNMHDLESRYRIALNVSCYFIAAKLFFASFATLIKRKIVLSRANLIYTYSFPSLAWLIVTIENPTTLIVVQVLSVIALLTGIIIDIQHFRKIYNEALDDGELYYAEGINVYINWMNKSVMLMIIAGVFSSLFAVFSSLINQWILLAYLIYFIGGCMYIFSKFMHFMNIYNDVSSKVIVKEIKTDNTILSDENIQFIETQVAMWIATKGYCQKKANIVSAANTMSTNRLYLSKYINTTYNCSFRVWVSQMRITEAKRILIENYETSITEVANKVGFLSLTSFTHTFKSIEGVSPKKWITDIRA